MKYVNEIHQSMNIKKNCIDTKNIIDLDSTLTLNTVKCTIGSFLPHYTSESA